MARALDPKEQKLLARQFVYDTQIKTDFLIKEIQRIGHSDNIKAIRRLLKEIFFFASEVANSFVVSKDVKKYSKNIKEWVSEALQSESQILSHELLGRINGQLFLMQKELKEIDIKTKLAFKTR